MDSEKDLSGFVRIGIAIVAGLGVGIALGWQDYLRTAAGTDEVFQVLQSTGVSGAGSTVSDAAPETFPVLDVLGGETYDFGVSKPGVTMQHAFIVKNRGTAPLELRLQDTTCKCLTMDLDKETPTTIPPGGEYPISLEFRAEKPSENYVQQARIKTNDPDPNRNILKLKIEGRVVSRINVRPEVLEVPEMTASEESRFGFNVYTFRLDDVDPTAITISEIECDDPFLQERLQFSWEPLSQDEIQAEYHAAGGYRVTGIAPAGMPMNNYLTTVTVKTSDGSEIPLQVGLSVKAPVTVSSVGRAKPGVRFYEESRRIEFGLLQPDESTEIELLLLYKTEKKGELDVTLGEVSPSPAIQAEFVKIDRRANVTMVRLKIMVPADCPPIQLNGPTRDNMAKVTIRSDSPEASEVSFHVSFSKK